MSVPIDLFVTIVRRLQRANKKCHLCDCVNDKTHVCDHLRDLALAELSLEDDFHDSKPPPTCIDAGFETIGRELRPTNDRLEALWQRVKAGQDTYRIGDRLPDPVERR